MEKDCYFRSLELAKVTTMTEATSFKGVKLKKTRVYDYAGSISYIKVHLHTEFDDQIVNDSRLTASQSFYSHGSVCEF